MKRIYINFKEVKSYVSSLHIFIYFISTFLKIVTTKKENVVMNNEKPENKFLHPAAIKVLIEIIVSDPQHLIFVTKYISSEIYMVKPTINITINLDIILCLTFTIL